MLLAADVGNTNVVFALFDRDDAGVRRVVARWRIATDPRRTADEYAVWLLQLLSIEGFERGGVRQFIIGSVVPRAVHNLSLLSRRYFNVEPIIAGEGDASWGIDLDISEPRSLGADRALNAIAAHGRFDSDLIIIDFGTATTFDVVDFRGAYKGGIIAPGVNLSLDALVGNTAKLPRIAIARPDGNSLIGRDTEEQMRIGVFWGYVAMMEGLTGRLRQEIGRPAKVIATGGLALLFDGHTALFDAVEPDLTLEGLAMLAERVAT